MNRRDVVVGILWRCGQVLITQRRPQDPLGGYWEFPGGKREPGETAEACLVRELAEELGISARPIRALEPVTYQYAELVVDLIPYLCEIAHGDPRPLAAQQLRWVSPSELPAYEFPPANKSLVAQIIRLLTNPAGCNPKAQG